MHSICLFVIAALASQALANRHIYQITFETASESWAGTNANVKIRLYGNKDTTSVVQLPYLRKYFEKGSVDVFEIATVKDLGEVYKISVGHDNSASIGNGWKLVKVVVKNKASPSISSEFHVNRWLENDDGKTTYVTVQKVSANNCGVTSTPRVVNGETATKNQWPWQVQIRSSRNGRHHCGGTLIHPQYVVTASHCVAMSNPDPKSFSILLGEHDINRSEGSEQVFGVQEVIVHESWNSKTINNDIAIIKLDRPALLNDAVKLACLPSQGYQLPIDAKCYVSGWGRLYGGGPGGQKLQQAHLPVVSNQQCDRVMKKVNPNGGITDNMVCAGGNRKSGCHGDSGGPFVCQDPSSSRFFLQGAVSWGSPYCHTSNSYTVFARIGRYVNWIEKQLKLSQYITEFEM